MRNCRTTIATVIFLFTAVSITASSQDYFPLSIGNSWTYHEFGIEIPNHPIEIIDTLYVNGDLYYYYGVNLETAVLICKDSLGRIWKYKNGEKSLWFDFTLAEADSYFYKDGAPYLNYVVKAYRNLSIKTKFGILEDCISFNFDDPNAVDEEHYYAFGPNIGLIQKSTGMGITWSLDSAIINGKIITEIFSNNISTPQEVKLEQNYPNPFNPTTTISYELPTSGQVIIKIYDLTGRLVKVIANATQPAGTHSAQWDGTDFCGTPVAAGIYIYRIEFVGANGKKMVQSKKMSFVK